ncbi:uncharacterized protein LOC111264313 isoform X3 [Varroa jacobsoni]|uniref:Essential protein Yae1 N-terminal domain-containing protein n=1 Tax=Varroa destructor TaxID=109461 RepID=A0A7M7JQZ5_VARDE|nr:uncharacterized protein LOC111245580 isoform X3 [Varroa destructor]XP_022695832.1 uncharacterized protein LOC111264313 isoform X3 [Varroa jacobsoni]
MNSFRSGGYFGWSWRSPRWEPFPRYLIYDLRRQQQLTYTRKVTMADEVVLLNEKETNSGRITAEPSGEDPQQQTAGDGDSESDSGEGCEARSLAEKAFLRKDEATASDGLREGLADGKEKALQQGFDSGFKQGFQLVENISIWRGFVQGLSTSIKKLDSGQEEKKQLYALYGKLLEFEQKVINSEAPLEEIRGQMEQVKKDIKTVLNTLGMAHLLDTMTDL